MKTSSPSGTLEGSYFRVNVTGSSNCRPWGKKTPRLPAGEIGLPGCWSLIFTSRAYTCTSRVAFWPSAPAGMETPTPPALCNFVAAPATTGRGGTELIESLTAVCEQSKPNCASPHLQPFLSTVPRHMLLHALPKYDSRHTLRAVR